MGVHCGTVSVGVAKTFVLLGEDVELAWKMEQTAEPLKIQVGYSLEKWKKESSNNRRLTTFKR